MHCSSTYQRPHQAYNSTVQLTTPLPVYAEICNACRDFNNASSHAFSPSTC